MTCGVVDTNVILVANAAHNDVSPECVIACVEYLDALMNTGALVVDDGYRIFSEYLNKTSPRAAKGVGDVFVQWALRNQKDPNKVHQVSLNEHAADTFAEFPDKTLEPSFDPADRKFAAVAHAHPDRPTICQAADCKWLDWFQPLANSGVSVSFLCYADVCRFYASKFPDKPIPSIRD